MVLRAIDLHIGAQHRTRTNTDIGTIKKRTARIDKNLRPKVNINTIGTVKRGFYAGIGRGRPQQCQQIRGNIAAIIGRGSVMSKNRPACGHTQCRQFIIQAPIPLPGCHFFPFAYRQITIPPDYILQ
jgi:hypothetical protein